MDPAKLDELKKYNLNVWMWHRTFLGQHQQHNYWLYHMLDDILESNPQIRSIIEIGTGHGALTVVLGLHGIKLGIPVMSVDIDPELSKPLWGIFKVLNIQNLNGNVFSADIIEKMTGVISSRPTYIICDGGDKPSEFRYWAPRIPAGSVISAHDWGVEITQDDVKDIPGLEPFKQHRWLELNVQFATFIKR